jgi:hypothetical protein
MYTKKVVLIAAALFATSAFAMDEMKSSDMAMNMKMMDANHDGMISKQEYMAYHENMWMKMSDSKPEMSMKDMQMKHEKMMKDSSPMKESR